MVLAERAGALQSEMLHTLNIDDEDEPYKYGLLFLIGFDENGIYVDPCVDVSAALGVTACGMLAAEKLTGVRNDGCYVLRSPVAVHPRVWKPRPVPDQNRVPLTRDELQDFLRACEPSRRKALLKKATI